MLCRLSCHSASVMQSEIKHVVLVMFENRSFDNLLAWLYSPEDQPSAYHPSSVSDQQFLGLTEKTLSMYENTLKDSSGHVVFTCHPIKGVPSTKRNHGLLNSPAVGPHEPYPHVIKQIYGFDGGQEANMSGFLQDYASLWHEDDWGDKKDEICAIMETYTSKELPVLYALARNYATSDLWFSSVPTQTNPNRAFAACGTSEGETVNGMLGTNHFTSDTIWNRLEEESPETSWTIFWQADMLPGVVRGPYYKNAFSALERIPRIDDHFEYIDRFHEKARNGELPDFSLIEPQWTVAIGLDDDWMIPDCLQKTFNIGIQGNDLHPPGDVRTAENFLANIYTSLIANQEAWEKTLLIVTFDEHGGLYDHISPPEAIQPDDYCQHGFRFDRYGVRIPTLLISPRVKKSTVFRSGDPQLPFDHTSLMSTILKWKNIDAEKWAFGKRVAIAPSFEEVVTEEVPREDAVLKVDGSSSPAAVGEPVRMNDLFYLKNGIGQYIITPKSLFKNYAKVGAEEDKVLLSFGNGQGKITHGSFVVVKNQDPELGNGNILEITFSHADCHYDVVKSSSKQWWTIKSVDHPYLGHDICYGDKVYFENHIYTDPFLFIPARLARRDLFNHFLTTIPITSKTSDGHYWIIEKPIKAPFLQ